MKKIVLSLLVASASMMTSMAQLLPNGDFETPIANSQLPKWMILGGTLSQTTSVTVNNQPYVSASGPRFIVLQNTTTVGVLQSIKFPLSTRPSTLRFLATYLPVTPSTERFGFGVLMTKKNGANIDTVLNTLFASTAGAKYPWVNFQADLTTFYLNASTPDSAVVSFITSIVTPTTNSSLLLDDIKFSSFGADVKNLQSYFSSDLQVTPNPATSSSDINISYQLNSTSDVMVDLYDMQGRLVRSIAKETVTYGTYNKTMSVDGLPAGMYVCKVTANDQVQTTKIVITQ
ncbi:MAG: T9SS type A sorting domain-containing protein [bacterium]|nr:T9SS type A sorting domain-containing protein [bacterium]